MLKEDLIDLSPVGIFSFNDQGTIEDFNAQFCTMLGFEATELKNMHVEQLMPVSSRIFFQTHLYPLIKLDQKANEIFLNFKSKTGDDMPVLLNAVLHQVQGRPIIVISFFPVFNRRKYEDEILEARHQAEQALRDNNQLQAVKEQLLEHQRKLDKQVSQLKFQNSELIQLNDIVAHDLQEPVRKLLISSLEIANPTGTKAFQAQAAVMVRHSAQRIKNLLLSLQEYLGIAVATRMNDQVNIDKLVEDELAQMMKENPQVQLDLQKMQLPVVEGNKNQLHWLFRQILQNAFVHGQIGNELSLKIDCVILQDNIFHELEDRYDYVDFARISFTDKGKGFENEYNEYVFKVLKKLDTGNDGLGFGLAFCKRIAENHMGSIKAISSPGNGATFVVQLPLRQVAN